jgi:hypothetical protein
LRQQLFPALGLLALIAVFYGFTKRGMLYFFSGDDMMNMHFAWVETLPRLAAAIVVPWMPLYRPLGQFIYRVYYETIGFHPRGLYIFCWLLLVVNLVAVVRLFRALTGSAWTALTAAALILVHGLYEDLYTSAGTIYDHLCFLFTVLALVVYIGAGERITVRRGLAIMGLSMLAMDSKESGAMTVALLGLYELIYMRPAFRRIRAIAPWYAAWVALACIFYFGRVKHTFELVTTAAYAPNLSAAFWIARIGEYMGILLYRKITVTPTEAAAVLAATLLLALALRSKPMIYGWCFFVLAITPVSLISQRPGYVTYVPAIGIGLYGAALIMKCARGERSAAALFVATLALVIWFHKHNWPKFFPPELVPEARLTKQFAREYPHMPAGAHLLFVSDDFPVMAYDLMFNLQLLYHDKTLVVHRLHGPQDQQPDPAHPVHYDYVFATSAMGYDELDQTNLDESIRLRILKRHPAGMHLDFAKPDHVGYLVSGVLDTDTGSCWMTAKAQLKFKVPPGPAKLTLKFWVPDFVARGGQRIMSVAVNGTPIAKYPLNQDGMNEKSFAIPAGVIHDSGFTMLDLAVDPVYKEGDQELGVVLVKADF